jgi:hypothetical protein
MYSLYNVEAITSDNPNVVFRGGLCGSSVEGTGLSMLQGVFWNVYIEVKSAGYPILLSFVD